MIEVTVKTLDSKNHLFKVSEELTVKEFKNVISPKVSVPVEMQRLIFHGRVLQDGKKISEHDVANNTVHLVQRPSQQEGNQNDEPLRHASNEDCFNLDGDSSGIIISVDDMEMVSKNILDEALYEANQTSSLPFDIEENDELLESNIEINDSSDKNSLSQVMTADTTTADDPSPSEDTLSSVVDAKVFKSLKFTNVPMEEEEQDPLMILKEDLEPPLLSPNLPTCHSPLTINPSSPAASLNAPQLSPNSMKCPPIDRKRNQAIRTGGVLPVTRKDNDSKQNIPRYSRSSTKGSQTTSSTTSSKTSSKTLKSTLTGKYWQIPENKCPANRPRRAKAGALMATKSRRNKKGNESKDSKQTSSKLTRVANKETSVKFSNKKPYEEVITAEAMLVNQKTALKCVLSIPDAFVPTPHEEFLEHYVDDFREDELFELFELIKGKSKITKSSTTSPKRRRLEQFRHSKLWVTASQRKLSVERHVNNKMIEPKIEENATIPTTARKSSSPPSTERSVPQLLPLLIKEENNNKEIPAPPRSSFHRKKFEEDEKTEYVKLGDCEILCNGVILKVDHVNYKCEKDVDILYDDYEFESKSTLTEQPNIPPAMTDNSNHSLADTTAVNSEKSPEKQVPETTNVKIKEGSDSITNPETKCSLPYCAFGCLCDSLKSERGPREHCGKLKCMIDCNCQEGGVSSGLDDVDIMRRLRPRVSMMNWSNRLNYPEAYSQEKELKDSNVVQTRIKRTIVPPRRNHDFVLHSPAKKSRDDYVVRPVTRQASSRISPFNVIGNRFRLAQRQYVASTNENTKKGNNASLGRLNPENLTTSSSGRSLRRVGLANKPIIQRAAQLKRNMAFRPTSHNQQVTRTRRYNKFSVEGSGDIVPPEYMAKMIPCMEIHFRPAPSRALPLSSESESSDDENDEEDTETNYATERFSNPRPVFIEDNEDSVPVIVSYRSCQDGFSEIVYPGNAKDIMKPSTCA